MFVKRLEATVYGRVQGVSFRHYTRLEAQQLGLTGWVANRRDGAVHVVAEGPEAALQQFFAFLQQGPVTAHVTQVEQAWTEATGEFPQFSIHWL